MKDWRDLFYFSKSERRALTLLSFLILGAFVTNCYCTSYPNRFRSQVQAARYHPEHSPYRSEVTFFVFGETTVSEAIYFLVQTPPNPEVPGRDTGGIKPS